MDAGTAVYGYDGEGRRMKKTYNGETTYYFYGSMGLLCEFTTTNTGATAAASTDRTTYKTSDKLGTAVLILNASGTVIENNRTLPYGEAWLPETASTNDKKFTTYQRDQESGLDYAMNRYYANSRGTFASADKGPIVAFVPASLNRYTYTLNDPVNAVDPDGNFQCRNCPPPPLSPGDDPLFDLAMGPGPSSSVKTWPQIQEEERQRQYGMAWAATFAGVRAGMSLLYDERSGQFKFGAGCEKYLAGLGTSLDAIKGRFLTTTLSTGEDTYVWETFRKEDQENQKRFYGSLTVAQWMVNEKRDAAAIAGGGSVFFNIWGGIASDDDETIAAKYLHELVHNVTGLYDPQLPANNINELKENCVK